MDLEVLGETEGTARGMAEGTQTQVTDEDNKGSVA